MLELGLWPLRYIIKMKRILYLHHVLTRRESSLVRKVLLEQNKAALKGDFIFTVKKDLSEVNIHLSFQQIQCLSKYQFKKLTKKACSNAAFCYLMSEKTKLSKGSEIKYDKLEMQKYLQPGNNLSLSQI